MTDHDPTAHATQEELGTWERPLFSRWLADHVRGTLDGELTAELSELVAAVSHHNKAGTLTLKLKVTPAGSGSRSVTVSGKVDTSPPEPDPEVGYFYVGPGGGLFREDPYQRPIPGVPYRDSAGVAKVVEADGTVRKLDEPEPPKPIADE